MEAHARRLVKRGDHTVLFDVMRERGRDRLTSGVIYRALEMDDSMTKGLIDDAVWALGVALASVQNVLDLEAIIVGGGLGDRLGEPFVERIAEAMQPHLFADDNPPAVHVAALGDLGGAIGASLLAARADGRRAAGRTTSS
jgi:glucokinase